MQAARELGVEKIIHTSSSEVYGTAKNVPISENHPLQGQSPYAASKIGADQLAMSFYYSFDTPVSIIRPFNYVQDTAQGFISIAESDAAIGETINKGFKRGLNKTIEWFANPDSLKSYKADRYNL